MEFVFFEDHHGCGMELWGPVTGPGRLGRHHQATEQDQSTVIVDPPAGKVAPTPFRGPPSGADPRQRADREPRQTLRDPHK